MKLKSFHVTDFHSVLDSNLIELEDVTCLVGKNEAGKTSLLKALYRLNPIRPDQAEFNSTDDYPRLDVTDYEEAVRAGRRHHAKAISATFQLTPNEIKAVEEKLGKGCLIGTVLGLSKSYDNKRTFALETNNTTVIKYLVSGLKPDQQQAASGAKDVGGLLAALQPFATDTAVAPVIALLGEAKEGFAHYAYNKVLSGFLPQFMYFDEYYQMTGCENIEQLIQRQANNQLKSSDYPLLGLIEAAGLQLPQLLNTQRTQELKNKLEGAGNRLTKRILEYWSQNKHLQMRFDVRPAKPGDPENMRAGTNIWGEVYDTRHFVSTSLGARSRGFVWFFSFVAWYHQIKNRGDNVILLLDEPGLTLHGRAQADLLRYFEKELVPTHQLIYSTHSPFMIDPTRFDRVRIVQDRSVDVDNLPRNEQGTKVISEVLDALDDSLFPLQAALGYDIHQTLFVGPNTLLVEGASDMLYLNAISAILQREGREGLSADWTLTPVGGASKIPTFVRLLTGQKGMTLATLIDIQNKDRPIIEAVYRDKLLKKANVLTFADFTGAKEADIEDMFEPDFYLTLFNEEYKDALAKPLSMKDLKTKEPRILVRIDKALEHTPLKQGGFSHYRPARLFHEQTGKYGVKLASSVKDRFQNAFDALNKLLA